MNAAGRRLRLTIAASRHAATAATLWAATTALPAAALPANANTAERAGYEMGLLAAWLCPLLGLLAIAAVGVVMYMRERRFDRERDERRHGRSRW
jgi:hypothetical protein